MLEKRYGGDDVGKKKYIVGNWLDFQLDDQKPIMEQAHKYENLVADIVSEGMKMCEVLQTNVLLENFPKSWSDYRAKLKHKKKDMSLQELISHIRTKEANRLKDKAFTLSSISVKANLVEPSGSQKNMYKHNHKKESHQKKFPTNKGVGQIHKAKALCYVCGKPGHKAYQCKNRKGLQNGNNKHVDTPTPQVNLAENDDIIAVVVVEANLVDDKGTWILELPDTSVQTRSCFTNSKMLKMESVSTWETPQLLEFWVKGKFYLKLPLEKP
ncbi:unnamed protein product [Cuscuta epithymum]|uniref:CCHC-type domain-containing protein n=1 Tax=Cuscuta epithymum TaxID=186058 RepID=A0AAV0DST9_9ASTE|nr:unnamed protein product [Cuscuta epithymum]